MSRNHPRSARLRVLAVTAAVATSAALFSVPSATAVAQATSVAPATHASVTQASTQRRVSQNLSSNPALRSSHRGYRSVTGARAVKRVKVAKGRSARFAASAVVTRSTTRISLPRVRVAPGQLVEAAADVRAVTPTGAHISVSWFDSSGRFLSWSGGDVRKTSGQRWTTIAAQLRAPANASVGETVVNVLDSKRRTRVLVTNHSFRIVAEPAPAPGSCSGPRPGPRSGPGAGDHGPAAVDPGVVDQPVARPSRELAARAGPQQGQHVEP